MYTFYGCTVVQKMCDYTSCMGHTRSKYIGFPYVLYSVTDIMRLSLQYFLIETSKFQVLNVPI